MTDISGIDFSEALQDVHDGSLLKPAIKTYLADAEYPEDFSVRFRKGDQKRPSDGWFWPSTHPTWPARALYLYLTQPESLPVEHIRYMNALSLTMGTAVHGFIEQCLTDMGLRPRDMNRCQACPPERNCQEPGFRDENTGSRGHMDGLLDLTSLNPPNEALEYPGLEFKTAGERVLSKIEENDVEAYRAKWPVYYAQNQEYMRLSGRRTMVVLFLSMGYPWGMKEFHVPYDPVHATLVRDKYLAVREAASAKSDYPCCGKTKSCPVGQLCGVTNAPGAAGENSKKSGAKRFLMKKDGTYGFVG